MSTLNGFELIIITMTLLLEEKEEEEERLYLSDIHYSTVKIPFFTYPSLCPFFKLGFCFSTHLYQFLEAFIRNYDTEL